MTKPISPKDIVQEKEKVIPYFVVEAFNELIVKNFYDGASTVLQKDVVNLIIKKAPLVKEHEIFDNRWLDIEDLYSKAGWEVIHDKPGYNESYKPYWVFQK